MTPAFAEEAVLGALMLGNDKFHEVATVLSAEQFTSPFRRNLWESVRDRIRDGEPADPVTVSEMMPGQAQEIWAICNNTHSLANLKTYASIVRGNWRRREAAMIGAVLAQAARNDEDGAIDAAIGSLLALNATATECDYTMKQALGLAFKQVAAAHENDGALPGITTGLTRLDDILGGWHNGDLILIGSRPAMGKTALMVNLAEAAAKSGKRVGIVSAEQPAVQIGLRVMALESRVNAADMRRGKIDGDAWARLSVGVRDASAWNARIYDRSAITLDELVSVTRKWKHTHGLDILFVDYAQRISVPGAERITEVSAIARGLKNLARDSDIPLIALAQVKAAVDTRNDQRPNAGDLANSDELTREADEIIMLYREEACYRDKNERGQPVEHGTAELLIEKNRHGPTGFVKCAFLPETMRFGNLERE